MNYNKLYPWDEIENVNSQNKINAQLADEKGLLKFYWAKDFEDNLYLILDSENKFLLQHKIPKLEGILISVDNQSKNIRLKIKLVDKLNIELFFILCKDLISSTSEFSQERLAIDFLLSRLEKWHYFLKYKKSLINKIELRGLIGELYFFKNHLLKEFNPSEALAFWKAPNGSTHDFEFNNKTIEVKTKSSVNKITISSYEQMHTELNSLYLYVLTLSDANENIKNKFNITNLINEIKIEIRKDEPQLIDEFEKLLAAYGFIETNELNNIYFIASHDNLYFVDEKFPKINEKPEGISDMSYRIDLNLCNDFIVENINYVIKKG